MLSEEWALNTRPLLKKDLYRIIGKWLGTSKPVPGWRSVLAAAVLALLVGGASQPLQAQAQPVVSYSVDVINPQLFVCAGATATYRVVIVDANAQGAGDPYEDALFMMGRGLVAVAVSSDANVGTFNKPGIPVSYNPDPAFARPNLIEFVFKAGKPGKTTLTFGAQLRVGAGSVVAKPFPVTVTVDYCHYKVTVISWSFVSLSAGDTIGLLSIIDEADMSADKEGVYRGAAKATWTPNIYIGNCPHSDTIATSDATLVGRKNDEGTFVVNVTYDRATLTEVHCGPNGGSVNSVDPNPISVTLPSTGGAASVSQGVKAGPMEIPGTAKVFVTPVNPGGK